MTHCLNLIGENFATRVPDSTAQIALGDFAQAPNSYFRVGFIIRKRLQNITMTISHSLRFWSLKKVFAEMS